MVGVVDVVCGVDDCEYDWFWCGVVGVFVWVVDGGGYCVVVWCVVGDCGLFGLGIYGSVVVMIVFFFVVVV